jgi:hypothetical protein
MKEEQEMQTEHQHYKNMKAVHQHKGKTRAQYRQYISIKAT